MEKSRQRPHIFVIDDDAAFGRAISRSLEEHGYRVTWIGDGESAVTLINADRPDLVLLDLKLAGVDGFEIALKLKNDPFTKLIPIIMNTGFGSHESLLRALECGVEEFITKPFEPDELAGRIRNLLNLKQSLDIAAGQVKKADRKVQETTIKLREAYRDITFTLTRAAEYRDEDTGSHVRRVAHYAWEIASCLGQDSEFLDQVFFAAPMHDVGKIGVPDSILLKVGPLDAEEWVLMRRHTDIGFSILHKGRTPFTRMGAIIAASHHERWDGTGYPKGLSKEQIPLPGRIMNICDQYDALRSARPYKPAFDHDKVMQILTVGDGRTMPEHFDPRVLEAFVRCSGRFAEIFDNLQEE